MFRHKRKWLVLSLAAVFVLSLGLMGTALAAGPSKQGNGRAHLPAAAVQHQPHSSLSADDSGTSAHLTGAERASERVQENFSRHIDHMKLVMQRVPEQARGAIQSGVERLQDRLQRVLNAIASHGSSDQTHTDTTAPVSNA